MLGCQLHGGAVENAGALESNDNLDTSGCIWMDHDRIWGLIFKNDENMWEQHL